MTLNDVIIDRPSFTLRYKLERGEIWRRYWSRWARWDGLWRYWLFITAAVIAGTIGIRSLDHTISINDFGLAIMIVFGVILFFIVFPQLAYKPRERLMTVDESGIDSSIGSLSAHRGWKDIASIADSRDFIAGVVAGGIPLGFGWVRTRNGNAFIIPNRAFENLDQRTIFLQTIKAWHGAKAVRFPRLSWTRYYE